MTVGKFVRFLQHQLANFFRLDYGIVLRTPSFFELQSLNTHIRRWNAVDVTGWSILWGTPVSKTCRPRKRTRMFSHNKLLKLRNDLMPCPRCGAMHQISTICGFCYENVRQKMTKIKQQLLTYNKSFVAESSLDNARHEELTDFRKPTAICEKHVPKTGWYSAQLKQRWHRMFDNGKQPASRC
ncbi:putative 39S ribosomal protein L32, mitochondrial [Trichinella patagoniensis]|uniref:Putative 39S ribosomal protein L32, mitochondrial n=1 Tax=Trichinella patagoniensis TaxID=990121 RepID=A0A0V1ADX2_9BILA|nr:putative 39S ribosomal protein L32, mitochondrial [Trichinella patagoniensis]